jgi:hypothetical protein
MSEQQLLPQRVVSGGQTGADQAGLIVARRFRTPTGGWEPGRRQPRAGGGVPEKIRFGTIPRGGCRRGKE